MITMDALAKAFIKYDDYNTKRIESGTAALEF